MKRMELRRITGTAGVVFLLITGCGKKQEAIEAAPEDQPTSAAAGATEPAATAPAATAPAPAARETLPGENAVREALGKKDYETAVGGLLALRGAATGGELYQAYLTLYGEVIDTLRVESSQNRKAAEALAQLQLATRAR